jgi:hypothetical protein
MLIPKRSSLRIASIVNDKLFQGLRYECELLPLTPKRFKEVINYSQPDFLLVESVRRSHDCNWNTSIFSDPEQQETLLSVVVSAREKNIPAVFWITVGQENFEEYRKTAELFDLIACADHKTADHLIKEGQKAIYLPPCVQTAIFNPFRHLNNERAPDLNILFEKGSDLLEFISIKKAVQSLDGYGITILESRPPKEDESSSISRMEKNNSPFAFLSPESRLSALKNAKAYVSCGTSTSTWVEQQWMALEAAACRTAVVHLGRIEANDLLSDIVIDCNCEEDFLLEFYRHSKDSLYRERVAHLSWRYVNEHHTLSHRITKLCQKLDLIHNWVEYPKVSVITPTYRKALLKRCIENYEIFDYPNKELVIVFNGNELPDASELGISERNDITLTYVPSDLFAGAALNIGHIAATGRYFFRVDDDDYYGPNYLKDMVIGARSLNADVFGKTPAPLNFEGKDEIYVKEDFKDFHVVHSPAYIMEKFGWVVTLLREKPNFSEQIHILIMPLEQLIRVCS